MNRQTYKTLSLCVMFGALLCVVGGWWWISSQTVTAPGPQPGAESTTAADAPDTRRDVLIAARRAALAPAIGEGAWINTEPLTLKALRGRVVIVDFWTFGCYNCRNTLPALKRWDARYRANGLTIVGVHSPESNHEKDIGNVRRQVRALGIRYPVVTDNSFDTWRAYGIEAWPTTVILDKQGRIRWTHIGEGLYDE